MIARASHAAVARRAVVAVAVPVVVDRVLRSGRVTGVLVLVGSGPEATSSPR
ncbi:hypothetical protein ACWIFB_02740 [Dietzia sp. NPDC055340]